MSRPSRSAHGHSGPGIYLGVAHGDDRPAPRGFGGRNPATPGPFPKVKPLPPAAKAKVVKPKVGKTAKRKA